MTTQTSDTAFLPARYLRLYFISLIVFAALYGYWNAPFSYAIDTSLGLNSIRIYTEQASYLSWLKESKSLIHLIGSFGFNFGLNHAFLSTLLSTVTSTIYVCGLGLISFYFIREVKISALLTIFLALEPPFRFLDSSYGLETIGSPHLSSLGVALGFLSIGLYLWKKSLSCSFSIFINVSIHPILALFPMLFILSNHFKSILFFRGLPKTRSPILFFSPILIPAFVFLYYPLVFGSPYVDGIHEEYFSNYLKIWDYHRSIKFEATLVYLLIIIAISLFVIEHLVIQNRKQFHHSRSCLSVLTLGVCLLYILPILHIPEISSLSEKLITGRFTSMIEPLIITYSVFLTYQGFKRLLLLLNFQKYQNTKFLIFTLLIFYLFIEHDIFTPYFKRKILDTGFIIAITVSILSVVFAIITEAVFKKITFFKLNRLNCLFIPYLIPISVWGFMLNYENDIQTKFLTKNTHCPKEISQSLGISSNEFGALYLLHYCNEPVLLNIKQIDYVPYFPSSSHLLKNEIEEIYEISFIETDSPNILNNGEFQKNWETRTIQEWNNLGKKYNLNTVVVPSDWELKLVKVSQSDMLNFYSISSSTIQKTKTY